MELEYKDNSRRGRYIVAAGVVLAVLAGAGAFFLLNQAQQQAGQATLQKVPVVVAARTIAARKPIEPDDVIVREVPIDATNAQGVVATPDLVIGRVSAVAVFEGQMVTTNLLASSTTGGQFSILDPSETVTPDSEAWRAVSITVPDDRAVGGLIQANQKVDVIVTTTVLVPQQLTDRGAFYTDKSSKVTYQDVLILAKSGTFYVIKANLALAEEISHLQATGTAQFSLALRPAEDVRVADVEDLGATTNALIERYGLPVPEVYPRGRGPVPTANAEPTPVPSAGTGGAAPSAAPSPAASGSPDVAVSPAP